MTTIGAIVVHKESILATSSHHFSITPLLQEQILKIGQEVVYSKASDFLKMFNSIDVTAKQIDRVCHLYGGMLHSAELRQHQLLNKRKLKNMKDVPKIKISPSHKHLRTLSRSAIKDKDDILYAMVDGSFLQFRGEDNTHKDVWKEIKMGRIFRASGQMKDISKDRNIIKYSDYVVSLGNVKSFLEKMETRLDDYAGTIVFINDGASWIWNWIEDAYPNAVQILDYFHAMEYLKGFAKLYFKDIKEKERWIERMENLLNVDKVDIVIKEHEKISKGKETIPEDAEEKLSALITYYKKNKNRMNYGTYQKKGYLVGSGPIESANRNIIQKRLKLSGQRWTQEGAQNIANLRAFFKSMRGDEIRTLIRSA